MPPGWIKAVNSRTLMDSFAKIDKVLQDKKEKAKTKCENCGEYFEEKASHNNNSQRISGSSQRRVNVGVLQLIFREILTAIT